MNIPIDLSKNIYLQLKEWMEKDAAKQIANDVPLYEAMENSLKKLTCFVNSKWEDPIFRNKYAEDIIEVLKDDPELFDHIWEFTKTELKPLIDEILDQYNHGKISKKEMMKQMKRHAIIYQEIKK